MKKLLVLTTALSAIGFAANAEITVMSWGGAYGEAQTEAFVKPFVATTGKATIMVDSDNPAPAIKAMVEAGNVTVDVASVEYADAIRMANDSRFGLAAAVMSKDKARCERVARAFRAGIVWINCSQPTFTEAPWGVGVQYKADVLNWSYKK